MDSISIQSHSIEWIINSNVYDQSSPVADPGIWVGGGGTGHRLKASEELTSGGIHWLHYQNLIIKASLQNLEITVH